MKDLNKKIFTTVIIVLFIGIVYLFTDALSYTSINTFFLNKLHVSIDIVFTLILLICLFTLFFIEPIPISLIALMVPVTLSLFSQFTHMSVDEALSGFSNTATITVMSMFVFSAGVQRSGVVQLLGHKISQLTKRNHLKQVGFISVLTGTTSGIINNTPVVAALIPMVRELARKTRVSPSKLLIPLSYSAMLGGTITLIGTSTNLLASQVVERSLGRPFRMFEFTGLGLSILIVGVIYLITIGYKLIPARIDVEKNLTTEYEMRDYLTKVNITEACEFVGKSISEINENRELDYDIIRLNRDGEQFMEPLDTKTIRPGDELIIRANQETLLALVQSKGFKTLPELIIDDQSLEQPLRGEVMVEIVVPSHSFLVDKTLKELNLLDRYDSNVLALRRGEELIHQDMTNYRFQEGDLILMLVTEKTLERMRKNTNFIIDREYDPNFFDEKKMYIAASILLAFIITVALNIIPTAMAALTGAFLMVFSGCIEKDELFNAIDWEVFFILSGLIPLGIAVEKTGTASFIAERILSLSHIVSPLIILMILYMFTSFMANIIGNNASVLLMLPIAITAAEQLGVNGFVFALGITFAASASFASPIGYQTNLMVYSSGGYKFRDFIVVGAPLQLLMAIFVPMMLKIFWGF